MSSQIVINFKRLLVNKRHCKQYHHPTTHPIPPLPSAQSLDTAHGGVNHMPTYLSVTSNFHPKIFFVHSHPHEIAWNRMKYAKMLELWKSAANLSVVLMPLWLIDHTNAKQFLRHYCMQSRYPGFILMVGRESKQNIYCKICLLRLLRRSTLTPFSSCVPLPPIIFICDILFHDLTDILHCINHTWNWKCFVISTWGQLYPQFASSAPFPLSKLSRKLADNTM